MIDSFEKGDIYFLLTPPKMCCRAKYSNRHARHGISQITAAASKQAGWLVALHARSHDAPITNDEPTTSLRRILYSPLENQVSRRYLSPINKDFW